MSRINFIIFAVFHIYCNIHGSHHKNDEHKLTADSGLHKVVSNEVSVIAVERCKLSEYGHDEKARIRKGKNDTQHTCGIEIAVMHMRQQIGNGGSEQHGQAENYAVIELSALNDGNGINAKHKRKCGGYQYR